MNKMKYEGNVTIVFKKNFSASKPFVPEYPPHPKDVSL